MEGQTLDSVGLAFELGKHLAVSHARRATLRGIAESRMVETGAKRQTIGKGRTLQLAHRVTRPVLGGEPLETATKRQTIGTSRITTSASRVEKMTRRRETYEFNLGRAEECAREQRKPAGTRRDAVTQQMRGTRSLRPPKISQSVPLRPRGFPSFVMALQL